MKKLAFLFIAIMLVQSINAQYEVYYDKYGNMQKGTLYKQIKDTVMRFKEALPLRDKSNRIVARTIGACPISSSSKIETGKNYYLFEVTQAEDTSLLGKPVVCQIIERRKSNLSGLEGRLILRPLYIEKDSLQVPLIHDDIYRRGLNRSNVKIWTLIPWFIAGSKAKVKPEEEIVLTLDL